MTSEESLLSRTKVIAVVGLSSNRFRASYSVSEYMQQAGYRIIPVNPNEAEILGEPCYPDLRSIPVPVEMVNIFRRPEFVPEIVEDAIAVGAKSVWMQQGIEHEEAAERARSAGLEVVMDRCLLQVHHAMQRQR